jgi:hypothetical protein
VWLLALAGLFCPAALADSSEDSGDDVELVVLQPVEISAPVTPSSWDGDLRDLPTVLDWLPGDPIRIIPRGDGEHPRDEVEEELGWEPPGERIDESEAEPRFTPAGASDSLLRRILDASAPGAVESFTTPLVNVPGQPYTGAIPPDTAGDVSPLYFVQAVNGVGGGQFNVYSKTGVKLAGPIQMDSFGTGSCATGFGDPIVLYDPLADRWLLSEFASSGSRFCVYISKTNDPITGGFWAYNFSLTQFPDYPKYAVWPDAYYVTTNESTPAAYALDRSKMLTGAAATLQRFAAPRLAGFGFQALTPGDLDGLTPPPAGAPHYLARHRDDEVHNAATHDPTRDFLDLFELRVNFTTPSSSTLTGPISVPIAEFDSTVCGTVTFSCFKQPTGSQKLDPLREVIMWRLAYRNFGGHETLVGNLVTDVGADQGGVRWFELRKTGASAWSLYQEGTLAPDSAHRWMGSLAMDQDGNIALAYNVVSLSVFPSLRYAGRLATDPLGSLPQGEASLAAGTASNNLNRYGDYAAMAVDPADDCTFWFTGEYNLASTWSTRIGAFRFPGCGLAAAPKPVPDGEFVPGAQMTAARSGANIDVAWDATACPASTYSLYYGSLADFTTITGAICSLPPTGSATALPVPDDSFWVLAGSNGAQVSSFGRDSGGAEEVFAGWPGLCAEAAQDTTATCP